MSSTLLGWLLIVSSIAISLLFIAPMWATGSRRREVAAGQSLLSRLRELSRGAATLRGAGRTLIVPGAAFLLVAGIGAATSYLRGPHEAIASQDTDSETLARLDSYARAIGAEKPAPAATPSEMLPDVNTMIERLAARLETAPNDVQGWRMLGWSYVQTARYEQAAAAYGRAAALDPGSVEINAAYEEARAKASGGGISETVSEVVGVEETAKNEAMPAHERDAAIRSMVDGLADRLERAPRDADGWTRLMRSRVVLGEREVAAAAFRNALEIFKDDAEASARIAAAAVELGLKTE